MWDRKQSPFDDFVEIYRGLEYSNSKFYAIYKVEERDKEYLTLSNYLPIKYLKGKRVLIVTADNKMAEGVLKVGDKRGVPHYYDNSVKITEIGLVEVETVLGKVDVDITLVKAIKILD